ncbi:BrnT family toxin [Duganella sp. FT134W]|uniref:BrnT family toxin n=1 Tax=Duganella margarita TaxID=2692170 RepID=A0A7X4H7T1_9BURK|nr:BrnT family toxin [Duganella margarita]
MRFTWDPRKAKANLRKHGVSFDEALTVFDDGNADVEFDIAHSDDEDRYVIRGYSDKARRLAVIRCYRQGGFVRIISARKISY